MTTIAWALILIGLGLMLLIAEVFVPSGGILFILSIIAMIVGVTMVFFAPESQGGGLMGGIITLACLFVVIPLLVAGGMYVWPKTKMGKHFVLQAPDEEAPAAAVPEQEDLSHLKGQVGKAIAPLRPSGTVLIQGRRIDSKTEGMFVDAGQVVKVIEVRAGQVIVRPLMADELRGLPEDLTS
jgi:membrane-bound serine protease (ClpP class)